jgi:hypothetical protein
MNCYKHPDIAAVAFCRTCGRPLCKECQRPVQGTIVCEEHAPQPVVTPTPLAVPPPVPSSVSGVSPGLAFVLGLIPGVGAIYNGQYAKGVVHVVILGLLFSIANSDAGSQGFGPLFALLIMAWWMYMAFEAYHTARKRQCGESVDEFSSLFPMKTHRPGLPIGPVVLIGLGVLFLLTNLNVIDFRQIVRYWPVALIALGLYMLYCRMTGSAPVVRDQEEAHDEQH